MKLTSRLLTLGLLALAAGACSSGDLSKTDSGGVTLSVTDFDGLPITVSARASGDLAQIGSLTVTNVAVDPSGTTSDLMNVEIQSYEVTYTRADTGTRVPPKLVNYIFGIAPVNGTFVMTDGLTIYFASTGHGSLGGYDIFVSKKAIFLFSAGSL